PNTDQSLGFQIQEATTFLDHQKMRVGAHDLKLKGLKRSLKEHKARLYIIRRCVVMLLRWHD
uniref:Uncharacterized protein n=4 Tax=Triticinae TaxID=1648030 RepID=A0A453KL47_AEGTS